MNIKQINLLFFPICTLHIVLLLVAKRALGNRHFPIETRLYLTEIPFLAGFIYGNKIAIHFELLNRCAGIIVMCYTLEWSERTDCVVSGQFNSLFHNIKF
jgi:hypothetical protein